MPKPEWPVGTICCGPLPDVSGAVCGICTDGECTARNRGKVGHLPLARCGIELSAADRKSLSVFPAGGSISFSFRHGCRTGAQITVSAPNLIYMLSRLSDEVREAFLAAAKAWCDAKKEIAARGAANGGGAGGDGGAA